MDSCQHPVTRCSRRTALAAGTFAVGAWVLGRASAQAASPSDPTPILPDDFTQARVTETWQKYADRLSFGSGQTIALLDDGCDLKMSEWLPDSSAGSKVIAAYDAIDGDDQPAHGPRGYHGSTIGFPSSLNHQGRRGVAFNNRIAMVRSVECCHCSVKEASTLAAALQWVIDNHRQYKITTINLAPVDDVQHAEPVPSTIDEKLAALRKLDIWVSAPCGNHGYVAGISWPACQADCFAIGAVKPNKDEMHQDRSAKTALLAPGGATSTSNAIACGAAMVLREAIEKSAYDYRRSGPNLPEAMLAIFQWTGALVVDLATRSQYRRLDLLAAVDHVFS